jgi:hypothetical protein
MNWGIDAILNYIQNEPVQAISTATSALLVPFSYPLDLVLEGDPYKLFDLVARRGQFLLPSVNSLKFSIYWSNES